MTEYYERQPFYMVKWREINETNSLDISIKLIHPDGKNRGLILEVGPECMYDAEEGAHLVRRIIRSRDIVKAPQSQPRHDLFGRALTVISHMNGYADEKGRIAKDVLKGDIVKLLYWEKQLGYSYE